MSLGRIVSSLAATAAVAGCAVVAVGMSRAGNTKPAAELTDPVTPPVTTSQRATPTFSPRLVVAPSATPSGTARPASVPPSSTRPAATPTTHVAPPAMSHPPTHVAPPPKPTSHPPASTTDAAPKPPPATHAPAPRRGIALPLHYSTGSATRVITVTASGTGNTTARLQAWYKAPGGGWLHYGSAVTAHIGADGMSPSPSEFRSATPMGSFTLTQAFGALSDPGTPLPYFRTNGADWWISERGPLYNTHQHCWSGCGFTHGDPNEHLYYETPYYNYAVVINTPSGAAAYPHGSAFFLHVTDGRATAGCVAIPQSKLVTLMRWLAPSTHPRILIGTA
jgi:L,D-peptidoglycan transpeptidase YkuD (ErfK/YbiS/YcfS/YnhG family)